MQIFPPLPWKIDERFLIKIEALHRNRGYGRQHSRAVAAADCRDAPGPQVNVVVRNAGKGAGHVDKTDPGNPMPGSALAAAAR